MTRHYYLPLVAALICPTGTATAQECVLPESVATARGQGGSMRTPLRVGVVMNEDSSLLRDWVVIHDGRLPLDFQGTPGVRPAYRDRNFEYRTTADVLAAEDLTAFDVRFLTFDVFGERQTTLAATEVVDIPAGTARSFEWAWRITRENDATEHFASIAFVARVRTADGQVHRADYDSVLCVAELFALAATMADLDPGN